MAGARKQTEKIREYIMRNVAKHPKDIAALAAQKFGISRQAIHRHLRSLVESDLLTAEGATRNRIYKERYYLDESFSYALDGSLEEDKVWRENIRPLLGELQDNVLAICEYGVTEIINNAIDHSGGKRLLVSVRSSFSSIQFLIHDDGVGIFSKIQQEFNLDNPRHAILELSKGKLTTDPDRHTGEGIFFTSRMFGSMGIHSGQLRFLHLSSGEDFLIEKIEDKEGTGVFLEIAKFSKNSVQKVFDKYASEFGFDRTIVPVELVRYGEENLVSRSQAKRLLARLDRFKEIWLNFKDVETIGQAFADEIFRVYAKQNPQVSISSMNANRQVKGMIERALSNT